MQKTVVMKIGLIMLLFLVGSCTKYKYYYIFKDGKAYKEQVYEFYDRKLKIKVTAMYRLDSVVNQSTIIVQTENKSDHLLTAKPRDFQIRSRHFNYQLNYFNTGKVKREILDIPKNSKTRMAYYYEDPYSSGMKKDEVLTIERFGLYVDGVELITEELHFSPKLDDIQDSGTPLNPEY